MAWRLAKSLDQLRKQVNAEFPLRRKSSDGTIGDEAHATRDSDHNPWVKIGNVGIVTAIDFTHDPDSGVDSEALAKALLKSQDPRIKYIISNKKIASGDAGPRPWAWRKYTGKNPHNKHMHLSVKSNVGHFDNTAEWAFTVKPTIATTGVAKKTVITARAVGGTVGTVATVAAATREIVGPVGETIEAVRTVTDNAGAVVVTTKEIVQVAPTGFFTSVLAFMQKPGFLMACLVAVLLAWGLTYYMRKKAAT